MRHIFHLSIPVSDLAESQRFYTAVLGGRVGRETGAWIDILIWGHQITLQHQPSHVLPRHEQRSRHFGVVLPWEEWEAFTTRALEQKLSWHSEPQILHGGTDAEHAKFYLEDPSGNLIEIKAYRNLHATFGTAFDDEGR